MVALTIEDDTPPPLSRAMPVRQMDGSDPSDFFKRPCLARGVSSRTTQAPGRHSTRRLLGPPVGDMQRPPRELLRAWHFLRALTLLLLPQGSLVIDCEDPVVKHGMQINRTTAEYFHGDSATFICNNGYFLIGNYLIKCAKNNTWYPSVPFCRMISPILCGAPIIPTGGVEPLRPYYRMGSTIVAYCNRNYCFPDETIEMKAQCEGYNMWDPPVPPCFYAFFILLITASVLIVVLPAAKKIFKKYRFLNQQMRCVK